MCSQRHGQMQWSTSLLKSAQTEKITNKVRTKNPTQLDPATNWQVQCSAEKQGIYRPVRT